MKKIILFITLLLLAINTVYAKEVTLVREKINNTYVHYYDLNYNKVRYLYAEKYIFEDSVAYCIELGRPIEGNIYTYTTDFETNNISSENINYLKLITYYGYNYPGHNTDKYYMATQEIIWNRMCRTYTNWVIDLNPSDIIDISEEKSEIISLASTHYKKPSFDNKEIEFTIGEELVLEDANNVLSRYVTSSDNVVIDGNKLIIKENFSGNEITFSKNNYTDKQFLLYTSGLSQKMIGVGGVDNVTSNLKIKLIGGSLEINKLDKDSGTSVSEGEATLKGAVYELYNEEGQVVDTIITGIKNKIENLPLGKYTLKEKTPPKGYMLDENIYPIEIIKDDLNVKLDVYDDVIKRKVEIFKVFASNTTGELVGEPDISFEIYDKNNTLINTITTDNNGYVNIILPYGTYTFKQINTTENYYKVEDFTITISEYDERPIRKLLSNSPITAKVKIIKKDATTKENIINSNIKFKIFDVKNNEYLSLKVSYPENKETTEFQVDKNGIFITPVSLLPGEYILEEVLEPMNGYLYNDTKIPFSVGESSNFVEEDNELYLEIPFYNERVKATVNIIKFGEEINFVDNTYYYKEILLNEVVFHLFAKEDIYENNRLIYKQDELVEELISDKNGKITSRNLPLGKYYLKEVSTTNNHILDDTVYDIDLAYKDEKTPNVNTTIKIKNNLPRGKLTINKYESNTTVPIPNTLIEICNKDNKVVYKGYTDKLGQITIDDFPYGEYYLSEVEAQTGYRLLEDKITFKIDKEGTELNIYNERIKVPNTGLGIAPINIFVIVMTLLGIVLIIFFPREKRIVILSIIIILFGITYFVITIYKLYNDKVNNQKSVEAYINNEIETISEEKYQYKSILEIPSINLKRGITSSTNIYNSAKYNIELVKEDSQSIVLAAHNGNNYNSFFKDLHTIDLGDEINYYENGTIYKYIYTDSYDIKKNGYADIYRQNDKKSIILVTCKDNTDDAQTLYIGYLKETSTY